MMGLGALLKIRPALRTSKELSDIKQCLEKYRLFADWSEDALLQIAGVLGYASFAPGEVISEPGEAVSNIYILLSGTCDLAVPHRTDPGVQPDRRTLHPGDAFGLETVLYDDTRAQASVIAGRAASATTPAGAAGGVSGDSGGGGGVELATLSGSAWTEVCARAAGGSPVWAAARAHLLCAFAVQLLAAAPAVAPAAGGSAPGDRAAQYGRLKPRQQQQPCGGHQVLQGTSSQAAAAAAAGGEASSSSAVAVAVAAPVANGGATAAAAVAAGGAPNPRGSGLEPVAAPTNPRADSLSAEEPEGPAEALRLDLLAALLAYFPSAMTSMPNAMLREAARGCFVHVVRPYRVLYHAHGTSRSEAVLLSGELQVRATRSLGSRQVSKGLSLNGRRTGTTVAVAGGGGGDRTDAAGAPATAAVTSSTPGEARQSEAAVVRPHNSASGRVASGGARRAPSGGVGEGTQRQGGEEDGEEDDDGLSDADLTCTDSENDAKPVSPEEAALHLDERCGPVARTETRGAVVHELPLASISGAHKRRHRGHTSVTTGASPAIVLVIPLSALRRGYEAARAALIASRVALLSGVEALQVSLGEAEMGELALAAQPLWLAAGAVVGRQGAPVEALYLVQEGEVRLLDDPESAVHQQHLLEDRVAAAEGGDGGDAAAGSATADSAGGGSAHAGYGPHASTSMAALLADPVLSSELGRRSVRHGHGAAAAAAAAAAMAAAAVGLAEGSGAQVQRSLSHLLPLMMVEPGGLLGESVLGYAIATETEAQGDDGPNSDAFSGSASSPHSPPLAAPTATPAAPPPAAAAAGAGAAAASLSPVPPAAAPGGAARSPLQNRSAAARGSFNDAAAAAADAPAAPAAPSAGTAQHPALDRRTQLKLAHLRNVTYPQQRENGTTSSSSCYSQPQEQQPQDGARQAAQQQPQQAQDNAPKQGQGQGQGQAQSPSRSKSHGQVLTAQSANGPQGAHRQSPKHRRPTESSAVEEAKPDGQPHPHQSPARRALSKQLSNATATDSTAAASTPDAAGSSAPGAQAGGEAEAQGPAPLQGYFAATAVAAGAVRLLALPKAALLRLPQLQVVLAALATGQLVVLDRRRKDAKDMRDRLQAAAAVAASADDPSGAGGGGGQRQPAGPKDPYAKTHRRQAERRAAVGALMAANSPAVRPPAVMPSEEMMARPSLALEKMGFKVPKPRGVLTVGVSVSPSSRRTTDVDGTGPASPAATSPHSPTLHRRSSSNTGQASPLLSTRSGTVPTAGVESRVSPRRAAGGAHLPAISLPGSRTASLTAVVPPMAASPDRQGRQQPSPTGLPPQSDAGNGSGNGGNGGVGGGGGGGGGGEGVGGGGKAGGPRTANAGGGAGGEGAVDASRRTSNGFGSFSMGHSSPLPLLTGLNRLLRPSGSGSARGERSPYGLAAIAAAVGVDPGSGGGTVAAVSPACPPGVRSCSNSPMRRSPRVYDFDSYVATEGSSRYGSFSSVQGVRRGSGTGIMHCKFSASGGDLLSLRSQSPAGAPASREPPSAAPAPAPYTPPAGTSTTVAAAAAARHSRRGGSYVNLNVHVGPPVPPDDELGPWAASPRRGGTSGGGVIVSPNSPSVAQAPVGTAATLADASGGGNGSALLPPPQHPLVAPPPWRAARASLEELRLPALLSPQRLSRLAPEAAPSPFAAQAARSGSTLRHEKHDTGVSDAAAAARWMEEHVGGQDGAMLRRMVQGRSPGTQVLQLQPQPPPLPQSKSQPQPQPHPAAVLSPSQSLSPPLQQQQSQPQPQLQQQCQQQPMSAALALAALRRGSESEAVFGRPAGR